MLSSENLHFIMFDRPDRIIDLFFLIHIEIKQARSRKSEKGFL